MLSAATISPFFPGWLSSDWATSRTSGTALAQPTPTTWYLSVVGSIRKRSTRRCASVGPPSEYRLEVTTVPISAGSISSALDSLDRRVE